MYKKVCNIFTMLVLIYLAVLYYLIKNIITKYLFILFSIYAFVYYLYICVYYYSFPPQQEIIIPTVNINTTNVDIQPDVIILKVTNISELNNNFSDNCCICLEYIDPLDSYKLNNCRYHLYHEECIKLYTMNNFKKCPICNI